MRSGLSTFVLRENTLESLCIFQRKTLRSILKLSKNATNPALYFLCGDLPIEGKLHRDVFSLFYSVWANPESKIYEVVTYLISNSCNSSRTWSVFLKQLAEKYSLEDPIECLNKDSPSKSQYKECVMTKITAFHENVLRNQSSSNSCMKYLNVSVTGLRGRRHAAISGLFTTDKVKESRCHIKMLCGDYLTYSKKSSQSGGSGHCRACGNENNEEDILHILTQCIQYTDLRETKIKEMSKLCETDGNLNFNLLSENAADLCQFLLDPTSLNLKNRINPVDPNLNKYFDISRSLCNSINLRRIHILKSKQKSTVLKH